jgi:glycosyltransferase involved in cell wall biosynthesis
MNNVRIIFVPFIHAFGGVERLILGLSHFLHEQGVKHSVVCFRQTIDFASYATWPMTIHELAPRRSPFAEGWALHRYMRAANAGGSPSPLVFDLKGAFYAGMFPSLPFHLHLTDPPSLLPAEVSKFALSLRWVYPSSELGTRHGPLKMIRGEVVHRINQRGTARALSVIAMTKVIAEELRMLYSVEAKIIRPGVRMPSPPRPLHAQTRDSVRMLSVSRLEPSKRLDWILDALAGLETSGLPLSKKIDWSLNLVGDGSKREQLQSLAEQLGIAGRVVFHGRVSDARLEEFLVDTHLFLMPAVQGYGLPALEALARGVPVILHRESCVSEILEGTPWAEIIEDGTKSLASAIDAMVDRLRDGRLEKNSIPVIPTETDWAHEISTLCRWV